MYVSPINIHNSKRYWTNMRLMIMSTNFANYGSSSCRINGSLRFQGTLEGGHFRQHGDVRSKFKVRLPLMLGHEPVKSPNIPHRPKRPRSLKSTELLFGGGSSCKNTDIEDTLPNCLAAIYPFCTKNRMTLFP